MAQDIQDLKNTLLTPTKSDWEVINSNSSINRNQTPCATNTNLGSTLSRERQDIRNTLLQLSKEDWELIDLNCARSERNQTTESAEQTSGLDEPSIPKKWIWKWSKFYRKAPLPSSRLYDMKTQPMKPMKNQRKKSKLTSNLLSVLNEVVDKVKSSKANSSLEGIYFFPGVSEKFFTERPTIQNVRKINGSPLIDMKKADDLIKTKSFLKCDTYKKSPNLELSKFVVTAPEDPANSILDDSDREFMLLEKQFSSELDGISPLLAQYQENENRHLANQREEKNRTRDLLFSLSNNPHTIATSSLVTPFGEKRDTPRSTNIADLRKKNTKEIRGKEKYPRI